MYAAPTAALDPNRPAVLMAHSGETQTYGELDARSNQLAQLLRAAGLGLRDHYAIFMENQLRFIEACGGGDRSGLYYTCINAFLKSEELAYILDNCEARLLITSTEKLPLALAALPGCPKVTRCLVVGYGQPLRRLGHTLIEDYDDALARFPTTPVTDQRLGIPMLYSSGTTGRPKGVLRALAEQPPTEPTAVMRFVSELWRYRAGMVYLSPAPLYHAAPLTAVGMAIRQGGTVVVMAHFDAEQFLALVERHRVTHSQLVPTMFSRLLKLPAAVRARYDLSSLEWAVHGAAPCPPQVKAQMIDWWGPIILEYYGATEGLGFAACDSAEWLAHRGTVGRVLMGELQVLDETMQPVPIGTPGTLWFKSPVQFEYFNAPEKNRESRSPDSSLCTVGDIGYLDEDGFLYLTDRASFMIISGGVNIYPQECENLLVSHPQVLDAAVFGVPNEDLGEEVKAVVQVVPGVRADAALAAALIDYCAAHLARQKVPRSLDFIDELPRLPTGKLYKRLLRDRYWEGRATRLI